MKVALTGGATGIGAATLARFKSEGHHVTVFDLAEPSGAQRWVPLDLSDTASINAALAQAGTGYDVLVNNAGLPPRDGQGARVLKVNFLGFRQFSSGFLNRLSPGASVVNVASRAGAHWMENIAQIKALMALKTVSEAEGFIAQTGIDATRAYNLSKEAVIAHTLSQTAAMIARDIRMNSVSPAAVSTGILDDFKAAFGEKVSRNIARAGRAGTPQEVANVIAFLASPESHWIKGVDICVDGGMGAMALGDALGLSDQATTQAP